MEEANDRKDKEQCNLYESKTQTLLNTFIPFDITFLLKNIFENVLSRRAADYVKISSKNI
jgi:hypothetical protein